MNTVGKIAFDFNMENEEFAHSLYGRWDNFFTQHVEKIADKIMERHNNDSIIIEIDSLNLDLGHVNEDNFNYNFPILFERKLEEALLKYIYNPRHATIYTIAKKDYLFDILCKFLLHGSLPWNIETEYKNINHLFLSVLQNEGGRLKSFLQNYGHYTSLQQRLVYQLNDPELEGGVRLLAPAESTFICSYMRLLKVKYRQIESTIVQESDYRNVVWIIVYAYLLTNRSSFFNKKEFIIQTITQIAIKYNLTYEHLLGIITSELNNVAINQAMPSELFLILDHLRKELYEKHFQALTTDSVKLYKRIVQKIKKERVNDLTFDTLKALFTILSKESSCRNFLQPLKEIEIEELVQYILPNESMFVVEYARSLDRQKENGVLEGKAGGEFRLLKWQIIFPVLLQHNSHAFNRQYFVVNVLQKVSAHYNLRLEEVVMYICSQLDKLNISEDLKEIFLNLIKNEKYDIEDNTISFKDTNAKTTLNFIKTKKTLNVLEVKLFIHQFSQPNYRKKIITYLTEEEHYYLTNLIIPSESQFIIAYAMGLNKQKEHGALEGKAGGEFKDIKWQFIYTVLFESHTAFNKKYFVSRTLHKLSAHYNIAVNDLLHYFYTEIDTIGIVFPFDLVNTLNLLTIEHHISEVKNEKNQTKTKEVNKAEKILQQYFGKEKNCQALIVELSQKYLFVNYIQKVLQAEQLLMRYLKTELKIDIERKHILQFLFKLSAEYNNLSCVDIMLQIISFITEKMNNKEKVIFHKGIKRLSGNNILLSEYIKKKEPLIKNMIDMKNEKEFFENQNVYTFVHNAGMVLFSPFIPRLFSSLELTLNSEFVNEDARTRAIFVLQYAIFGERKIAEQDLILNKLLTGLETDIPLPQQLALTDKEKDTVTSMLKAVLNNWAKLKNTSIEGLQEAFLRREGKLEEKEDGFHLTVEEKAYDMLLDSLPWNFRRIKFSWMKKSVYVKWR